MKTWKVLLVLMMFVGLIGCAGSSNYLPEHALTNPVDAVSIPHPIEIEKTGIKTVTTFVAVMDPALWTEIAVIGGIWPVLAQTLEGKILKGYAYLSEVNYWGDFLLRFVFCFSKEDLGQVKILYFNRDGGWAYQLSGKEIRYDPKKFDDDKEYQNKIFSQFGMTLSQMDSFWIEYLGKKEIEVPDDLSSIQEMVIGSPEWKNYKKKLASVMKYNYKMANGKIRTGYLPLDAFRQEAVRIPGFNGAERFLERAKLPLIALPFTGIGLVTIAAINIVGDAVVAGVDDDWSGYYARAKIVRYQMAPLFRQICLVYKKLLEGRDERIKTLEREVRFQKILSK